MPRITLFALLLIGTVAGCSSSETATTATTKPVRAPEKLTGPAAATQKFMDALSQGDVKSAERFLTAKSLARLNSTGVGFRDPGFGTGDIKIGRVEQSSATEAVVQCFVTEQNEAEEKSEAEICWFLRQDEGQWRVAGFAVQEPSLPQPIIWNFETADAPQMASPPAPVANPQQAHPAVSTAQNATVTPPETR